MCLSTLLHSLLHSRISIDALVTALRSAIQQSTVRLPSIYHLGFPPPCSPFSLLPSPSLSSPPNETASALWPSTPSHTPKHLIHHNDGHLRNLALSPTCLHTRHLGTKNPPVHRIWFVARSLSLNWLSALVFSLAAAAVSFLCNLPQHYEVIIVAQPKGRQSSTVVATPNHHVFDTLAMSMTNFC